eukprot:CAMPEP_0197530990 /NCGR_PEP_ID=MMETSP1318-20131121/33677_1 /TAXON_ID=552666 /ORGANISM="Partenskyella glossopodia, Strain RCC365" /LENGTH=477 /DNA_ID=CAMNT_0043087035 /DNA_START=1 /DNA_END=1431 /DNA_ORIENTATION=+
MVRPERRPSIKKILHDKIVKKRLKAYISKIFRGAETSNRTRLNLSNCRQQLALLGLSDVLVEIEQKQKRMKEMKNQKEEEIRKKWQEQKSKLKEEEERHKRVEDAFRKLKEEQNRRKKLLLDKQKRAGRKEAAYRKRTPLSARRQQDRLLEAKKRREALLNNKANINKERQLRLKRAEELRRKRASERKRVAELDQWGRKKPARYGGKKKSVMAEEKLKAKKLAKEDIEDDIEDQQNDLMQLQRAREELEKHLGQGNKPEGLVIPSKPTVAESMSPKERVLFQKEQRKKAEDAKKRAALLAQQQQLVKERLMAENREKAQYQQAPSAESDEDVEEVDDAELEENDKYVQEIEKLVQEQGDRVMQMRKTLQQTLANIVLHEDDDEEENTEKDGEGEAENDLENKGLHNQTANICIQYDSSDSSEDEGNVPVILNSKDRVSNLRQQCIAELGEKAFREAYLFLKKLKTDPVMTQKGRKW